MGRKGHRQRRVGQPFKTTCSSTPGLVGKLSPLTTPKLLSSSSSLERGLPPPLGRESSLGRPHRSMLVLEAHEEQDAARPRCSLTSKPHYQKHRRKPRTGLEKSAYGYLSPSPAGPFSRQRLTQTRITSTVKDKKAKRQKGKKAMDRARSCLCHAEVRRAKRANIRLHVSNFCHRQSSIVCVFFTPIIPSPRPLDSGLESLHVNGGCLSLASLQLASFPTREGR